MTERRTYGVSDVDPATKSRHDKILNSSFEQTKAAIMSDGKPGLSIESAASVVLRDTIIKHMAAFSHVIRNDRAAGQSVVAAYIDGLAGAMALVVAGGHDDMTQIAASTDQAVYSALQRDLQHLRRQ